VPAPARARGPARAHRGREPRPARGDRRGADRPVPRRGAPPPGAGAAMDVFSHLVAEGRPSLWQAALHAAHELGVFTGLRADRPLDAEAGFGDTDEACRRYHRYLGEAGAEPARRLMERIGPALPEGAALLDIGAGIGTYAAAWLAEGSDRQATLVDREEV